MSRLTQVMATVRRGAPRPLPDGPRDWAEADEVPPVLSPRPGLPMTTGE
ncbi:MAG: hypothetical protein ACRDPF_25925 [Streptosporangiaceae bacterium]